jgi:hypothetical protein
MMHPHSRKLGAHPASVRVCGATRGTLAENPHARGGGRLPALAAGVRKLARDTGVSAADTHAGGERNH